MGKEKGKEGLEEVRECRFWDLDEWGMEKGTKNRITERLWNQHVSVLNFFLETWNFNLRMTICYSYFLSVSSLLTYYFGKNPHFYKIFSSNNIVKRATVWEQHVTSQPARPPTSLTLAALKLSWLNNPLLWLQEILYSLDLVFSNFNPTGFPPSRFHLNQYFHNMINWVEVEMAALHFFH